MDIKRGFFEHTMPKNFIDVILDTVWLLEDEKAFETDLCLSHSNIRELQRDSKIKGLRALLIDCTID